MTDAEAVAWVTNRLPADLFDADAGDVTVTADKDEVLVIGHLAADGLPEEGREREAAAEAAIDAFRSASREQRVLFARQVERRTGRKVSWGARCGGHGLLFTHLTVPTMTRLRLPEREVLDTLVAAGIARSRSDALSWCVKHVRTTQQEWLEELRGAFDAVAEVAARGPKTP